MPELEYKKEELKKIIKILIKKFKEREEESYDDIEIELLKTYIPKFIRRLQPMGSPPRPVRNNWWEVDKDGRRDTNKKRIELKYKIMKLMMEEGLTMEESRKCFVLNVSYFENFINLND